MRTMPRCESQPISGLCHLLIRILPIIRPWGFVLLERLPCANPSSSRKHAFPRFHFPGAGSAPGRCGTRSGTPMAQSENVRAWNLQRWRGRGPAHLIPARCAGLPARSAASVCSQARILWKLWADATWRRAPMPRSAQWIVHNTNHWGAVRPNTGQDQGSNDRSCQVRPKWDDDPPAAWLRTSGSSKTFPPIV